MGWGRKRHRKKNRNRHKRMSWEKRNFQERAGWQNRHHDLAKSKGGSYAVSNIIWLDERRHSAFHLIFQNRTFLDAARLLIKAHNMKNGDSYGVERVLENLPLLPPEERPRGQGMVHGVPYAYQFDTF